MFNFMLKHKKGFTLVELMLVVALMGFGVVALANLFQSALRTYNKTEERYIKQEMVKSVAEFLQNSTNITAATKAEVYPSTSVVPTVAGKDNSYAYIYAEKEDRNNDNKYDGYYLYILERGANKETGAVCLNPETPLYITFNVYQDEDFIGAGEVTNQCGVKVYIAAVDNDFDFGTVNPESGEEEEPEGEQPTEEEIIKAGADASVTENNALNSRIQNYIFYGMDVSYHFPNMIPNNQTFRVNRTNGVPDKAAMYTSVGKTNKSITSVDENGTVLRISSDSAISSEGATNALSVASFCFIATAGYGKATGEVGILCEFRDQCLKTNPLGRMFVKAYYTVSPPIADFIAEHEPLKAAVRVALKPLVAVSVYALEPELLIDEIPYLIMGIGSLGGIVAVAVYRRKKRLA